MYLYNLFYSLLIMQDNFDKKHYSDPSDSEEEKEELNQQQDESPKLLHLSLPLSEASD